MVKAAAALALALLGGLAAIAFVDDDDPEAALGRPEAGVQLAGAAAAVPPPRRPAFTVGAPELLDERETTARYAPVTLGVTARAAPTSRSRPVAALQATTEEGTTNIVLVAEEARRSDGRWVRVHLATLPNGRTGWVPRRALGGYSWVHTRLVVDQTRLTATLLEDGRPIFRAPVGVGVPEAPTPTGEFYVRLKLAGFGDPFYGPVAFGTNARSAVLTDWPGGGYIGIHGTNAPGLIPGRVSHGCIRMRNRDILALGRLMPVGTPLTIR